MGSFFEGLSGYQVVMLILVVWICFAISKLVSLTGEILTEIQVAAKKTEINPED